MGSGYRDTPERDPGRRLRAAVGVPFALAIGGALAVAGALVAGQPRPNAESPPAGHTGGFGEPTCHACHFEYEPGMDGTLTVEGLPERYAPGAQYPVTLVLRSAGMERAGFQAAARFAMGKAAGRPAGALSALDSAVVVRATEGGLVYVQHAPGGRRTEGSEVTSWTFAWVAPETGEGPVAFHVAANSANDDNSPLGDVVYLATDTVQGPGAGAGG